MCVCVYICMYVCVYKYYTHIMTSQITRVKYIIVYMCQNSKGDLDRGIYARDRPNRTSSKKSVPKVGGFTPSLILISGGCEVNSPISGLGMGTSIFSQKWMT